MRLEIGNFYVREVCFGEKTSFADGLLTVNQQEALDFVRQDSHITQAELAIVHPGQMVRLCRSRRRWNLGFGWMAERCFQAIPESWQRREMAGCTRSKAVVSWRWASTGEDFRTA